MRVALDLHGFTRVVEVIKARRGDRLSVPLVMPLSGDGVSGRSRLTGQEDILNFFSVTFAPDRHGHYRCAGCWLCQPPREAVAAVVRALDRLARRKRRRRSRGGRP